VEIPDFVLGPGRGIGKGRHQRQLANSAARRADAAPHLAERQRVRQRVVGFLVQPLRTLRLVPIDNVVLPTQPSATTEVGVPWPWCWRKTTSTPSCRASATVQ